MTPDSSILVNNHFGHRVRVRACGILITQNDLLLVGHQLSTGNGSLFWSFPGGEVIFGETLEQAIIREFKEETGLAVKVGSFLFSYEYIRPPLHAIEFYFVIESFEGELLLGIDPELPDNNQIIEDVAFFKMSEISNSPEKQFHDILQKIDNFDELLNLKGHF